MCAHTDTPKQKTKTKKSILILSVCTYKSKRTTNIFILVLTTLEAHNKGRHLIKGLTIFLSDQ